MNKTVIKYRDDYYSSFNRVKYFFIAVGIIGILAGIFVMAMTPEPGALWCIIGAVICFALAGIANGLAGIAKAAAIYVAKMEMEYDLRNKSEDRINAIDIDKL